MPALITYRTQVLPDWVDYNGHLRDAFYLLIFSYATDALMERIGLDSRQPRASGHSLFTLEAHLNYLHEVKLGTEVWVQTQIIGFDASACTCITACTGRGSTRRWRPVSRCCCTSIWRGRVGAVHRAQHGVTRGHGRTTSTSAPALLGRVIGLQKIARKAVSIRGQERATSTVHE
jgi:acyl-CoA thioesterase FadM